MPHFGQLAGTGLSTPGHIGHTQRDTPAGTIGSSAIPHLGQVPGPSCTISGCIGHVYLAAGAAAAGEDPAPAWQQDFGSGGASAAVGAALAAAPEWQQCPPFCWFGWSMPLV
jgi:hypothetical protein